MQRSSKHNIKSIITLNIYSNEAHIFKSNLFRVFKSFRFNKSNFITSFIHAKDLISTKISIGSSVPEDDILDLIEIKAYEDLGLDESTRYIVSSTEISSGGENREFHIFVVTADILDEYFNNIVQETKYIDLITPAPLLLKALYKNKIVDSSGVHSFVYFSKNDAFIAFYKNGEYLYSKSLEYSLPRIYNQFCQILGETIEEESFYAMLMNKGLNSSDNKHHEILSILFETIFNSINDVVLYAKRALRLDVIDLMYIGSTFGPIAGIDMYGEKYLGIRTFDFNFDYNISTKVGYVDQLQYLMLINASDYLENGAGNVNLTRYPRPPSFLKRSSGQVIVATVLAVVLGLIYPIFHLLSAYTNDTKSFILKKQNQELTVESNRYKKLVNKKQASIAELDKKIKILENSYNGKTKTLRAIYDKKVHYRLKSEIFYSISNELDQFDVNIDEIYTKNDIIWISLIGSDERKLTSFIKYLSDEHFNEIEKIDIEKIDKNSTSNHYKGLLKVELK